MGERGRSGVSVSRDEALPGRPLPVYRGGLPAELPRLVERGHDPPEPAARPTRVHVSPEGCGPEPAAHRLYALLAWRTLQGLPLVAPRRAYLVEGHLISVCRRLDVEPVAVHADEDRVHLLLRFKPGHALSDVARRVKQGSREALARGGEPVRWGRGFAVCSLDPAEVPRLKRVLAARAVSW